ncbi:hypothetical protein ACIP5U_37990 [Streptomyces sp. NPDC088788]|uniref:hypothetical protein n=1 Tax=Streptomyces sp. NPDC088788 TaxID=3365898 RepID=UPI0038198C20
MTNVHKGEPHYSEAGGWLQPAVDGLMRSDTRRPGIPERSTAITQDQPLFQSEAAEGADLKEHLISIHTDIGGTSVSVRQVDVDFHASSRDILLAIVQWIIVRDL